jgi:hypothetical protein
VDANLAWGVAFTLSVLAVLGGWFVLCGRADKRRGVRAFAKRTFLYAGLGFVLGLAFLTSDLGTAPPQGRMGLLALTVCCFLLLYAALSAIVASNDQSPVLVNLTGRPLLLSDPALAPFYTLPAPQEEPARVLPPVRPRTYYVVTAELGRLSVQAGRSDILTIEASTAIDCGDDGPLRVRRLVRPVSSTPASR